MEFIVPKFIDREPKIIGPFTFKQFLYLLIPGGICLFLYFFIAKKHFSLFILITVVLMGGSIALAFIKVKGYPLTVFVKNFFSFSASSKVFIWRRKIMPPKVEKFKKVEKEAETPSLKISERSHLQKISVDLETRKNK